MLQLKRITKDYLSGDNYDRVLFLRFVGKRDN